MPFELEEIKNVATLLEQVQGSEFYLEDMNDIHFRGIFLRSTAKILGFDNAKVVEKLNAAIRPVMLELKNELEFRLRHLAEGGE